MKVQIIKTPSFDEQMCRVGNHRWSVARLAQLSTDFEVMDIPLAHLNICNYYDRLSLREMTGHMRAVLDADMSRPIILDEDGDILDGRHRIMRALLDGNETIKAVRFETNPRPCEVREDAQ